MKTSIATYAFLLTLFFCFDAFAQTAPDIQWQQAYGGKDDDRFMDEAIAPDGGYTFFGFTDSNDSSLKSNHGKFDCWMVHADTLGNVLWQKLYGGSDDDFACSFTVTLDKGYILFGHTYSTDGDVNDPSNSSYYGKLWVVKTDGFGNIQWQKTIDFRDDINSLIDGRKFSIIQTYDRGYLFTTPTYSGFPYGTYYGCRGQTDMLVVRLDSLGNEMWRRCLGSSSYDEGDAAVQTADGGFLIMGNVSAGDGDVTDFIGKKYNDNVWEVKLSSSGDVSWSRCLTDKPGSITNFFRRKNGSLLLLSPILNKPDSWNGIAIDSENIIRSQSYGGSGWEDQAEIIETADGKFITIGGTDSKNGDVSGKHGSYDAWIYETDSLLNLIWQRCLGGSYFDNGEGITVGNDGGLLMCGFSSSSDGDATFNHGYNDGWVVKLKPECAVSVKASFTFIQNGLNYSFNSLSKNTAVYEWDFGDGTSSTEQNPTHNYSNNGIYEVKLTITNGCATDYHREIINTCNAPAASFTLQQLDSVTFQFNNTSQNSTLWAWKFGDSTSDRAENPIHAYKQHGIYYASVTAKNDCDSTAYYRLVSTCGLLKKKWGFTSNGLEISFHDSSENAISWHWDFGDGTSSHQKDPVHTFPKIGKYYVDCTMSNPCESVTVSQDIAVCANITSSFSFSNQGLDYTLINHSFNARSYIWHFDSITTITNPGSFDTVYYTFISPGYHTVCLTAINDCDSVDTCVTFFATEVRHIHECWYQTFSDSVKAYSYKTVAAIDSVGNLILTVGNSSIYSSKKFTLLKYDTEGNLIWSKVQHEDGIVPYKIILDRDSNIFIFANATEDTVLNIHKPLILKYDQKGKLIKQVFYDMDDLYGYGSDMVIDNLGNIYATASSNEDFDKAKVSLFKFDNDLNPIWQLSENSNVNLALHLTADSQGNVYMTAQKFNAYDDYYVQNIILYKYDASGNLLWSYVDEMEGQEDGSQLVLDHDQNPVFSVNSVNYDGKIFGGSRYTFLIKRNKTDGKLIFKIPGGYDVKLGVAIDSGNNYYWFSEYGDITKYSSAGNQLWQTTYWGSSGNFNPYAFSGNKGGEMFVTGYSIANKSPLIESFKMNPDGNVLWAKTFDTGDPDEKTNASLVDSKNNYTAIGFIGDVDANRLSAIVIRYCNECDALSEIHSISGDTVVCAGTENILYSVDSIPDANNYIWSYNTQGVTISSNGNNATLYIAPNAVSGSLNVFAANDCDSTLLISKPIHVLPMPQVTLHLPQDTFCAGSASFILSGGTPLGGNYSGEGVYNGVFYPDSVGTGTHEITYAYRDSNGCMNVDSESLMVTICTGLENFASSFGLETVPNPFTDNSIIRFSLPENSVIEISLRDLSGRKIRTIAAGNFSAGDHEIELEKENLSAGIYLMQLKTPQQVISKKIIIR